MSQRAGPAAPFGLVTAGGRYQRLERFDQFANAADLPLNVQRVGPLRLFAIGAKADAQLDLP